MVCIIYFVHENVTAFLINVHVLNTVVALQTCNPMDGGIILT